MSERWGYCGHCQRWFYAQAAADDADGIDEVRCPVCDASPAAVRAQPAHDAPAVAS